MQAKRLGISALALALAGCAAIAPTALEPTRLAPTAIEPIAQPPSLTPTPSPISAAPTPTPWDLMSPTAAVIPPASQPTLPPVIVVTSTTAPLPVPPPVSATLVTCATAWFTVAAPPAACPDGPPQTSSGAFQLFQYGAMIWRPGKGYIVLPFDPATLTQIGIVSYEPDNITVYRDTTDQFPAPPGLFAPVSGFGIIWRGDHYPENIGGYGQILRWATAPEVGYTVTEQAGSAPVEMGGVKTKGLYTVIAFPDGRIVWLSRLALPNQPTSITVFNAP